MPLYLIRHPDALPGRSDDARQLSDRGRSDACRMGAFLASCGAFSPAQIWHSPLVRARQTAELMAATMTAEPVLVETAGLRPEDDPFEIASRLGDLGDAPSLAIVGHEPYLSALATLLVRGKPGRVLFEVRKCSVLAFEPTRSIHKRTRLHRWCATWHLSPELLPKTQAGA